MDFGSKIDLLKCSSHQEKLLKFEVEGREFATLLWSLEQFIQTVKGQNHFLKKNTFSEKFFRSDRLEKLEFKLKK